MLLAYQTNGGTQMTLQCDWRALRQFGLDLIFEKRFQAWCLLAPFEVEREKRHDGNPDLVTFRGHIKPDERCAPRELNTLKFHRE
jgi:hypothetical protein